MKFRKTLIIATILSAQLAYAETGGLTEHVENGVEDSIELQKPSETESRYNMLKTGKQKLGKKWSDEQRVDNCRVPVERRGDKPRPLTCYADRH